MKDGEPFFCQLFEFLPLCDPQSWALDKFLVVFLVGATGATVNNTKLWHNESWSDRLCCRSSLPALRLYFTPQQRIAVTFKSKPAVLYLFRWPCHFCLVMADFLYLFT